MTYESNQGYSCEVVKHINSGEIWVVFENGFVDCFRKQALEKGEFRNKTLPSVCGVGIVFGVKSATSHPLYSRWKGMLERCYSTKHPAFKNYGAKGVLVCDRWKHFRLYIEDVSSMHNYSLMVDEPGNWEIDKDIEGALLYSKDTCKIISKRENVQIANFKTVIAYYKDGTEYKTYDSVNNAAKDFKGTKENISRALNGIQKTGYGYIWKYKEEI